jgi:hypothetical protein
VLIRVAIDLGQLLRAVRRDTWRAVVHYSALVVVVVAAAVALSWLFTVTARSP